MSHRNNRPTLSIKAEAPDLVDASSVDSASLRELDRNAMVFCRQAGRVVSDHICVVFRQQVGETGKRACDGCVIDAVLYRTQKAVTDGLRVYNA